MVRIQTTLAACLLGVMVAGLGCTGNGMTAEQIQKQIKRNETWAGEKMPEMHEVTYKGKSYVLGSKKSADALATAGTMPKMTMKGIGYGPDGATVIFEDNKLGMADILVEQYEAKYGKKQ